MRAARPSLLARALRRLGAALVTLVGITLVTFALVHAAPGDPAALRAGTARGVTEATIAANRALAGLDRPVAARYVAWLGRSARLDFGRSLVDGREVRARIAEALPATAALALAAVLLALALAVPVALALARARSRSAAATGQAGVALGIEAALVLAQAVPTMAIALVLLEAGAPYGRSGALGLLAPSLCLALPAAVALSRQQAAALVEALRADWARAARARGLGDGRLLVQGLRSSLAPTVALLAAEVPALLSGAVLVEAIFGVRGLGTLGYEALLARDYPLLVGLATVGAAVALAASLVADVTLVALDPRLRDAGAPTDPVGEGEGA